MSATKMPLDFSSEVYELRSGETTSSGGQKFLVEARNFLVEAGKSFTDLKSLRHEKS